MWKNVCSGKEMDVLEQKNDCPICGERKKKRSAEEQAALLKRLRRAEGQIRGIENMVENDAWCPDILIQVSAVNAALNGFNKELLASHLRSCVVSDIKSEDPAVQEGAVDELVELLRKLMK